MQQKKGQLSYEYILVIGMLLVLLIPFFYSFSIGLTGGVGTTATQGSIERLAQASKTLAHLGGATSRMIVSTRMSTDSNQIRGNRIIALKGTEKFSSFGAPRLAANSQALTKKGINPSLIQMAFLDTVVIDSKGLPVIVGACPGGVIYPTHANCNVGTFTTIKPNEKFTIVGVNFAEDAKIYLTKSKKSESEDLIYGSYCGNGNEACWEDIDCGDTGQRCGSDCQCTPTACGTENEECNQDVKCGGNSICLYDICQCSTSSPDVDFKLTDMLITVQTASTGKGVYTFVVQNGDESQSNAYILHVDPKEEDDD